MDGGFVFAMICIGVIQVILIFTILKIKEVLDEINARLKESNELVEKVTENTK